MPGGFDDETRPRRQQIPSAERRRKANERAAATALAGEIAFNREAKAAALAGEAEKKKLRGRGGRGSTILTSSSSRGAGGRRGSSRRRPGDLGAGNGEGVTLLG